MCALVFAGIVNRIRMGEEERKEVKCKTGCGEDKFPPRIVEVWDMCMFAGRC